MLTLKVCAFGHNLRFAKAASWSKYNQIKICAVSTARHGSNSWRLSFLNQSGLLCLCLRLFAILFRKSANATFFCIKFAQLRYWGLYVAVRHDHEVIIRDRKTPSKSIDGGNYCLFCIPSEHPINRSISLNPCGARVLWVYWMTVFGIFRYRCIPINSFSCMVFRQTKDAWVKAIRGRNSYVLPGFVHFGMMQSCAAQTRKLNQQKADTMSGFWQYQVFQIPSGGSMSITAKQTELVIKLRTLGFSYGEISAKVGVSRASAYKIIKDLGYDPIVKPVFKGSLKKLMGEKQGDHP